MKRKKAEALRREWGGGSCEHPAFAREYDMGERTGFYICTTCGAQIGFRERAEILKTRGGGGEEPETPPE